MDVVVIVLYVMIYLLLMRCIKFFSGILNYIIILSVLCVIVSSSQKDGPEI
jgi:hypothetical protein